MRLSRTLVSLAAASAAAAIPAIAEPEFTRVDVNEVFPSLNVVRAADFDGDGDMDVLVGMRIPGVLRLLENDGNQNFTARDLLTFNQLSALFVADVDSDGDADIVTGRHDSGIVGLTYELHENTGASPAVFVSTELFGGVTELRVRKIVDVDLDGAVDFLAYDNDADELRYFRQNEQGFSFPLPYYTFDSSDESFDGLVDICDVDNDGVNDLIFFRQQRIWWRRGISVSPPSFDEPEVIFETDETVYMYDDYYHRWWYFDVTVAAVEVGDINQDGLLDLVQSTNLVNDLRIHQQFDPQQTRFTNQLVGVFEEELRSLLLADMDGDADIDIVGQAEPGDSIRWLENDGQIAPSFTVHVIDDDADRVTDLDLIDIDADQDLDILARNDEDDTFLWYANGACRFDLNADGAVGAGDLSILIGSWGMFDVPADAFLNGVGTDDLAELIGRWGPCP